MVVLNLRLFLSANFRNEAKRVPELPIFVLVLLVFYFMSNIQGDRKFAQTKFKK
jgi:hypothetical protein